MLAKVFKHSKTTVFKPFSIPELGSGNVSKAIGSFVIPAIGETQFDYIDADAVADVIPYSNMDGETQLQMAQDEAARIINQAEENAAIIQQVAADKAAYDATVDLQSELNEKVIDLRVQLTETIESVASLSTDIRSGVEIELVELALQIARKIVGREVTIDREIALTLVKVSLAKLHNRSVAEVHLHSDDFAFVTTHREKLDFRGSLELVEDRSISPGGCLIHTETGDIDARIESQFDEISHGLFI